MADPIPNEPPTDEQERAEWYVRRLVKMTTGRDLSAAEAKELFAKARARMGQAMRNVNPQTPRGPK